MKVFFDGACRGREGRMAIAVVAGGRETIIDDLGEGTSGEAEWRALLLAMETARGLGGATVLLGDSRDVVAKANGRMPARGDAAAWLDRFRALAGETPPRIRWIKRAQNLAGIALDRRHVR